MSELKVELSQVDRSDIQGIKAIISGGFRSFFDESKDFSGMRFARWYEGILGQDRHTFAIRVFKSDTDVVSRSWVVGVCGLTEIDWVSRHARLLFVMVDKDGHKSTIQDHPATSGAFNKLLKYAFFELGMNKVWVSSMPGNNISDTLINYGFVVDGIRRKAVFSSGKFRDETVFSLLSRDFMENIK
jgi:RimJ/RimL family protein N-acetyltransferase